MSFCATKGPKTWGIPISPHPLKRPRRGGDGSEATDMKVVGFVFSHFIPFVAPFSKARTQRPEKTEIARKKRKGILAISASQ